MPPWADYAAKLDAGVDSYLGDTISYSRAGGAFEDVQGFVILAGDVPELGVTQIDSIREVDRVKLNAALGKPADADRLRHSKLGAGTFKPTNAEPSVQGRYWIFELQKVAN